MDSLSNRILDLVRYIESFGIQVNIGKNKARGNKGFFQVKKSVYRIDISKKLPEEEILRVLVHEFVHFVHYSNDKSLNSLHFIFGDDFYKYEDELISLTVDSIPKSEVRPLFDKQSFFKSKIDEYKYLVKNKEVFIENSIKRTKYKYLLKYDRVKVIDGLKFKVFSVDELNLYSDLSDDDRNFLSLLLYKRALKRLNSKISRLNKYYNSPTELLSRSFEYYFLKPDIMKIKAPELYCFYDNYLRNNKNKMISNLQNIFKN